MNREHLIYDINNSGYNFQYKKDFACKITLDHADKDQSDLLLEVVENLNSLYEGRRIVLNTFKKGIFPLQTAEGQVIWYVS